jgi:hypothetical protein
MNDNKRIAFNLITWAIDECWLGLGNDRSPEQLRSDFHQLVDVALARFNRQRKRSEPIDAETRGVTIGIGDSSGVSSTPPSSESGPTSQTHTRTIGYSRSMSLTLTDGHSRSREE